MSAQIAQDGLLARSYLLHEKLGEGGMGEVYRATHLLTGRQVALKRLLVQVGSTGTGDLLDDTKSQDVNLSVDLRLHLAHEFEILASLHHPNIVNVLDYGFDEGKNPFYTMELLPSPQTIVQAGAGLSVRGKVELLVQLLRALNYLHRRNILHRDLG